MMNVLHHMTITDKKAKQKNNTELQIMLYCISYCGARSRYMVHCCWKLYLRGKTWRFLMTSKVFYAHRHIKHTLTQMHSFPFNLAVRGWRHNSKKKLHNPTVLSPSPLSLWPSLHLCSVPPFIILSHYSPFVSCREVFWIYSPLWPCLVNFMKNSDDIV